MSMIEIEYRHTDSKLNDPTIRRKSVAEMNAYIKGLVYEMQMADISCNFKETVIEEGTNAILINKMTIDDILDGLKIKMLEVEESCDLGKGGKVVFGRPVLDWKKEYIEDIPDTLMKNAIAKVFADMNKNKIDVIETH